MRIHRGFLVVALLTVAPAGLAAPADAKLKAKSSLVSTGGKTRLIVKLASTTTLRAATKPRKVSAKVGTTKVKLKRAKGAGAGGWRSSALSASVLAKLNTKVGKRLTLVVTTRSGKITLRPKLTSSAGGGGGGSGGGQAEDPKAAAFSLINGWEFYRAFATQYTSGEEMWRMCAGGTFFYRYTSQGQYTTTERYGNGSWSVASAKSGVYEGYNIYEATVPLNGTFDNQPKQGNAIFDVSKQTTRSYINDGQGLKEFQRRNPTGNC